MVQYPFASASVPDNTSEGAVTPQPRLALVINSASGMLIELLVCARLRQVGLRCFNGRAAGGCGVPRCEMPP